MTNQKGFGKIILLVTLAIVLAIVLAYFAFFKKPVEVATSPTPTVTANPATSWKTYRNTKYDYSFRYPTDFTMYMAVDQTAKEVTPPTATSDEVYLTNDTSHLFCCEPLITSISVISGFVDVSNWRQYANIPDYRIKSQKEIVFAGRKAFEVRASVGLDSAGARLILIPGSPFSFKLIQGNEGEPWESITNSFSF